MFSKGGFVSVPVVAAASFLKIPVLAHESDITPGLANKIAGKFADKLLVGAYSLMKEALTAVGSSASLPRQWCGSSNTGCKVVEHSHLGHISVHIIAGGGEYPGLHP